MAEYRSKYTGAEVDALLDKIAEDNVGDIDSALSTESENPVMNKVVTEELNKLTETVGEGIPIGKGDAENSAVLKGEYEGYSNKAISQTSMAVGAATTAGIKGWYYSAIDFSNKKITLSDKPTYILVGTTLINGGWSSDMPNIKEDDVISLVNDSKYDFCSKVTAVKDNVITVDSLPFTGLVKDSGAAAAVLAGQFSDGYSVYIPERPDAGIIDFGGGAFSEGGQSKSTNICSHAEGLQTHAYGQYSHAEGRGTKAGYASHAEGWETVASGEDSHSEGYRTIASGKHSHAEGAYTIAEAAASHAEGEKTTASGNRSHSEGYNTTASGSQSHSEGNGTVASNNQSHAEGNTTIASGKQSHAEGLMTTASGLRAHTEGQSTEAAGSESHAEGLNTKAIGDQAHAEGYKTTASGIQSHAEGQETVASGDYSHAGGLGTETKNSSEVALGRYNKSATEATQNESEVTLFTLGIGRSSVKRKNAVEVKANGDVYIIGVGGYDGTNSDYAQTLQEILANL